MNKLPTLKDYCTDEEWERINNEPCTHEWVSIKDGFPEVPKDKGFLGILIASYSELRKIKHVEYGYFKDGNFYDNCDEQISLEDGYWELTHWMYLPEPPNDD